MFRFRKTRFMRFLIPTFVLLITACAPQSQQERQATSARASEQSPPIGAYMIVQGKNYNPADLGPYAASLPPIYAKYGGRYVAFTTDIDVAEGENDAQAVIVSAWPSSNAARAFWDSPEYAEAIKLRDGIGEFEVIIIDALLPAE